MILIIKFPAQIILDVCVYYKLLTGRYVILSVVTEVYIGTFRSKDEDDYENEFSVLSMRIRFGGRHFSKCACSEKKTRTRSCTRRRPRPPI